jgi:hypothetical protein
MKNLLIGYFYNVKSLEGIKVFIKSSYSLKNKSFDTVLLDASDDGSGEEIKEFAKDYDVSIVKIKKQIDSLYIDRFQAYKEYLSQTTYHHIILSDCTDVYLQKDPFLDLETYQSGLVLSSENALIKDIQWNYDIIKNVYGYEIADRFIEEPIINSGIIAGDKTSLDIICSLLVSEHDKTHRCFTGSDQGILMKIIYSKQYPYPYNYQFAPSNFSLMLAAGFGFSDKLINSHGINIDGIKITDNLNKVYSIIHQYNRKESFNNKVIQYFST